MNIQEQIGERLRKLRISRGLNQTTVGDAIGLSAAGYGKLELGQRSLALEYAIALADLFGVSCDYILRGVEAENVAVCNRTGLTNETVNVLEQREKQNQEWRKKEEYHEKEYLRLREKLNAEGYIYDADPDNQEFDRSLEHEEAQWEARFERENCAIYNYLMNAILKDSRMWETLVQASEQACRNVKELYVRTMNERKKAYEAEVENNKNAINAAKYVASMAFAGFFEEMCNDIELIECTGFTPVHEEDITGKFRIWLENRNHRR